MTGMESVVKITKNLLKTNEAGESCISVDIGCYLLTNKVHKEETHLEAQTLGNIRVFFFFDTLASKALNY